MRADVLSLCTLLDFMKNNFFLPYVLLYIQKDKWSGLPELTNKEAQTEQPPKKQTENGGKCNSSVIK